VLIEKMFLESKLSSVCVGVCVGVSGYVCECFFF
jgi:hypothetical protein